MNLKKWNWILFWIETISCFVCVMNKAIFVQQLHFCEFFITWIEWYHCWKNWRDWFLDYLINYCMSCSILIKKIPFRLKHFYFHQLYFFKNASFTCNIFNGVCLCSLKAAFLPNARKSFSQKTTEKCVF